jgi:hypothetical protein
MAVEMATSKIEQDNGAISDRNEQLVTLSYYCTSLNPLLNQSM